MAISDKKRRQRGGIAKGELNNVYDNLRVISSNVICIAKYYYSKLCIVVFMLLKV